MNEQNRTNSGIETMNQTETRDIIKEARACARIALRTIFHASGNARILDMYNRLYSSCKTADRFGIGEAIPDNYDCVSVAAVAICEYGHMPLDSVIGQGKKRDGSIYPITVRMLAIKAVNRYVMAHRGTHGKFTTHYTEDIRNSGEGWKIDNRYHIDDMQTLIDIHDTIDALNLSEPQRAVLKMRLLGYGVTDIARQMRRTQSTISEHLSIIQKKYNAFIANLE